MSKKRFDWTGWTEILKDLNIAVWLIFLSLLIHPIVPTAYTVSRIGQNVSVPDPNPSILNDSEFNYRVYAGCHNKMPIIRPQEASLWDKPSHTRNFLRSVQVVADMPLRRGIWLYPDYHQSPAETIIRRGGDCEDFSILLGSSLIHQGYDKTRVLELSFKDSRSGHSVVFTEIDGERKIIDPIHDFEISSLNVSESPEIMVRHYVSVLNALSDSDEEFGKILYSYSDKECSEGTVYGEETNG